MRTSLLLPLLLTLTLAAIPRASANTNNNNNNRKPRVQTTPKRNPKAKGPNNDTAPYVFAPPEKITQVQAPAVQHDTCLGYYDVSGQFDKEFACNNTDHRFCCGSCFLRFCCADRGKRLEQRTCTNYNTPDWIKTQPPSPAPTGDTYDPELDRTNTTVYITCGVVTLVIAIGIAAKVAYDKATKPPQEMNVHRALADIMRQQGISQYEHEDMAAVDSPSKDETPVRTSKNHYTPIHSNHGHYGKENLLPGGQDMHNFISSGFVTIGRGHFKAQQSMDESSWQGDLDLPMSYGNHHHDYQHSHLDLTALTPKRDRPQRMNNILTAATEPYDVSLSRSFQNLSHLPQSYEVALKADLSKLSSSMIRLSDKDMDEYYPRKHHHQDFHVPSHMVKLSAEPPSHQQRQRPRGRVQRAMSQDHVLSPPRTPRRDRDRDRDSYGLSSYGAMASAAYGSSRNLSKEQLLSVDRLQSQDFLSVDRPRSQDPLLLSPAMRRDKFRQKAMARAMSHADMLMPTTPVRDRHNDRHDRHKPPKLHAQMSTFTDSYNTLSVNHLQPSQPSTSKRQAFASRRTHTVDHMSYMSGQAYRSASKNEVTV